MAPVTLTYELTRTGGVTLTYELRRIGRPLPTGPLAVGTRAPRGSSGAGRPRRRPARDRLWPESPPASARSSWRHGGRRVRSAPRFSPRRRRAGARTRPFEPVELGNFR